MARHQEACDATHPLVYNALHEKRSIFNPYSRVKMNILPMFLVVFVPWGIFAGVAGVCGFSFMFYYPSIATGIVGLFWLLWLVSIGYAVWARIHEPEPMWYTFIAIMLGFAVVGGTCVGYSAYAYSFKYHEVMDLKNITNFDAGAAESQDVMDGSIFHFDSTNHLDAQKSWHFKKGTLYCVVPIVGSDPTPDTQYFDFWAVGKDCCSETSSDFRCNDAQIPTTRTALRIMDETDQLHYRLATQQAQKLYRLLINEPIFFEWYQDVDSVVTGWSTSSVAVYTEALVFFFVVCLFCMTMAVVAFSYIGRTKSVYDMDFYDEDNWRAHPGQFEKMDLRTQKYYA